MYDPTIVYKQNQLYISKILVCEEEVVQIRKFYNAVYFVFSLGTRL